MKKFNYLIIICFLTLFSTSCDDLLDKEPEQNDDLPGALIANINGESFDFRYQPRAYEGGADLGDGNGNYDAIFISGTTSVDFTRELWIDIINPAVGTFEIDPETLFSYITYTYVFEDGTTESYGSIAGSITIVEYGDKIKGTFNATLINYDAVEIPIEGSFDLSISD